MSVVINEFEVVAEPEARPASNAAATAPVPAQLDANEMEPVLCRLIERALRVRAD
jgi:hypothetical protein